jgi:diguanylate cyclase (GGDEF)-like protein/PAS domain S-box-containing protein
LGLFDGVVMGTADSEITDRRYRHLFEMAGEAVLVFVEGRAVFYNPAARALFGMTESEPADLPIGSFVHPEDRDAVLHQYRRHLGGEDTPRSMLFRIVGRDGALRWVEARADLIDWEGANATLVFLTDTTERKEAELAIAEGAEKFRILFENSPDAIVLIDEERCVDCNAAALALLGCRKKEDLIGHSLWDFAAENQPGGHLSKDEGRKANEITARRGSNRFEWLLRSPDNREIWAEVSQTAVPIGGRQIFHTVLRDITKRKKAVETLLWKTTFLEALVDSTFDGILILDEHEGKVTHNQRVAEMWNMPPHVAESEDPERWMAFFLASIKNPEDFYGKVEQTYRNPNDTIRGEFKLKNGMVVEAFSYPVLDGKSGDRYGRIWVFRDITEVRRYWDMLESLSTTDGLTGISNRRRLDEFLEREWRKSMRDGSEISLLLMDIDYFKEFNDRYGHLAGDDCLKRVAEAVDRTARRPGDIVARYGGEEFAYVLGGTGEKGAKEVARRVMNELAGLNIPHEGSSVADHVTMSIGVATGLPRKGEDCSDLVRKADRCLYAAKQRGRNRVEAVPDDYINEVKQSGKRPPRAARTRT